MTIIGGLEDVIAGDSAISSVSCVHDGTTSGGGSLSYRGYDVVDLCERCSCYEEVAFLLIFGKLPTLIDLKNFKRKISGYRELNENSKIFLNKFPGSTNPMDVLRTFCSYYGALRKQEKEEDEAIRLLGVLPSALVYWHSLSSYCGFNENVKQVDCDDDIASFILKGLSGSGRINKIQIEALNASLICYAEHDFNASTFAARVTTSTLSDYYSAMTSAIGTLRGRLHGGANEEAMKMISMFLEIRGKGDRIALLNKMRNEKRLIMGFGHRIYRGVEDPRSKIMKKYSKNLCCSSGNNSLFEISEEIESFMVRERHIYPNADFYSASVYNQCGIPTYLFTPLFAIARIAGWTAHIIEQRNNNRLIRPKSNYVGPQTKLALVPLQSRL